MRQGTERGREDKKKRGLKEKGEGQRGQRERERVPRFQLKRLMFWRQVEVEHISKLFESENER